MPASNVVIPFKYSSPDPFVLPNAEEVRQSVFTGALDFLNDTLPRDFIRREAFHIDSVTLEEIMANVSDENNARGNTKILWRSYKTSGDGWTTKATFDNPKKTGVNLAGQAIEVFSLIVDQIQIEIEKLLADTKFPDDLGRLFGRTLANNTTINGASRFTDTTKLPSSVTLHIAGGTTTTVDPLTEAQESRWPFDASLIGTMVPIMGVSTTDPRVQNANISTTSEGSKIRATDPNFPQSPYGDLGGNNTNIPGVDVPMSGINRTVYNRVQKNAIGSNNKDVVDPDMGYGYLTGHSMMIEQLRYQPPQIETFPNTRSVTDYASNLFSNTTPNLPWVLSLPVETQIVQNWGLWLIKGNVGVTAGGAFMRAYQNPSAQAGSLTQCPFAVFFPPQTVTCSCSTGDGAYFLWARQPENPGDLPLIWDGLSISNTSRGKKKLFGRNTKMIVEVSLAGASSPNARFLIGVRTERISDIQQQPFTTILSSTVSGTISVNIMDELASSLAYTVGGVDAILAIRISVGTSDSASAVCDTANGPTGTFVPESCKSVVSCTAGDFSATVRRLRLEDPTLVGDPVDAYQ